MSSEHGLGVVPSPVLRFSRIVNTFRVAGGCSH
jgi:hypothetical protein